MVTEAFAEKTDIPVGVFFTPGASPQQDWWVDGMNPMEGNWWDREPAAISSLTSEAQAKAHAQIISSITNQVSAFIAFLYSEGILYDTPIRATLNGSAIAFDVPPMIKGDTTMVPIRAVFDVFDIVSEWNADTRTAIGIGENVTIEIPIGSNTAYVNGEAKTLTTPAFIYNNRTFVPLRFVAEATGANVEWDADTRTAIITTGLLCN